jgi:hypothetical protein
MRQGSNILPMMSNPVVGQYFSEGATDESQQTMAVREEQKEHEIRLLGTMLFQALFLSMCILLYSRWEWAQFNNSYEAMVFWFTASFALQAGFYFVFRALIEDASHHRRNLKRMRQSNRRRMGSIKYEQEKVHLESVLNQQLASFQNNLTHAMSDGVISSQQQTDLGQQVADLVSSMQTIQPTTPVEPPSAQDLGVDRHHILGIPVGGKLTIDPTIHTPNTPIPEGGVVFPNDQRGGFLNLTPTGTKEDRDRQTAAAMENAVAEN